MEIQELTGYYTYRSFLNLSLPVNDFNTIKHGEAELFLMVQADGTISGTLSFPAEAGAGQKLFMDIAGRVKNWSPQLTLEFKGKGRPTTSISDYQYEYLCSVTPMWENGIDQRVTLTGTVHKLRTMVQKTLLLQPERQRVSSLSKEILLNQKTLQVWG